MTNQTIENLFEGILIVDSMGQVQQSNQAFSTIFGISPRKAKSADHFCMLFNYENEDLNLLFENAKKSGQIQVSKEFVIKAPRELHITVRIIPNESEFIVTFWDISVEKNLHEKYKNAMKELKGIYQQMLQADKVTNYHELTSSISHEISNPLTIALGNTEVAISLCKNENKLKAILEDIESSLNRIITIVDNMKESADQQEDKKSYNLWKNVVDESIELVKEKFQSSAIDLTFTTNDPFCSGYFNKVKIQQVIINLLNNAHYAVKETGRADGKVNVVLDHRPEQQLINFTIADNGCGIPLPIQENIFTPFFTTKDKDLGSGLGLSISEKIVKSINGEISFVSDGKSGTTFTIAIPTVEVSSYAENSMSPHHGMGTNAKSILIIDNDPQILNTITLLFENDEQFQIIGSTNPLDALNFIDNVSIDAIITDYVMPQMSGHDFAKKVQQKTPQTPIIYLTSKSNIDKYEADRKRIGISGFISKPFSKEDIVQTLNNILGKANG